MWWWDSAAVQCGGWSSQVWYRVVDHPKILKNPNCLITFSRTLCSSLSNIFFIKYEQYLIAFLVFEFKLKNFKKDLVSFHFPVCCPQSKNFGQPWPLLYWLWFVSRMLSHQWGQYRALTAPNMFPLKCRHTKYQLFWVLSRIGKSPSLARFPVSIHRVCWEDFEVGGWQSCKRQQSDTQVSHSLNLSGGFFCFRCQSGGCVSQRPEGSRVLWPTVIRAGGQLYIWVTSCQSYF